MSVINVPVKRFLFSMEIPCLSLPDKEVLNILGKQQSWHVLLCIQVLALLDGDLFDSRSFHLKSRAYSVSHIH